MELYSDFVANNSLLFIAFVIVLFLLIQTFVQAATRKYAVLNPAEATTLINRQEPIIIDVRGESDFNSGHISNAINIPFADLKENPEQLTKYENKALLLYCKSGARSAEACALLSKKGISGLHSLSGGLLAWQDDNMPLSKH